VGGLGDIPDFDAREEPPTKTLLDILSRGGRGPFQLLGEEDLEKKGGREGGRREGRKDGCVIPSKDRLKNVIKMPTGRQRE
jgi:hypothetical protein